MKLTIITPSYFYDLERCELLCRSVDRFASAALSHVLIVDRGDLERFRHLRGPRRDVLAVEEILPGWIRRMPFSRKWWFSAKTRPIRNWILQQIVKLSVGKVIDSDAYVFIDSDVALVSPLVPESFVRDGRLSLFRVPAGMTSRNAGTARRHGCSGCPRRDFFGSNYVGNLITWRRDNLERSMRGSNKRPGCPGSARVARQTHFSEYTLYGI